MTKNSELLTQRTSASGFTLIEMIVALAVFTIVVLISVGSLLSITHSNRKAQAQKTIMNNLNFALESMTRTIRVGTNYRCADFGSLGDVNVPADCPTSGGTAIAFERAGGNPGSDTDQVIYQLNPDEKTLQRSLDGGSNFLAITAPEVEIDTLEFYVNGTTEVAPPERQPHVLIVIKGHTGATTGQDRTEFSIQTLVTQRLLDN